MEFNQLIIEVLKDYLRAAVMYRLIAVAFIYLCVLTMHPAIATSCYPCASKANREWNVDICKGDIKDCGNCLYGFDDMEGKCQKKTEIEIKTNSSVFIYRGTTVHFDCYFSQPVDCAWHRRGHHLLIDGRYSYKGDHNGLQTLDCSLTIKSFRDIDVGQWKCESMATSSQSAMSSTHAYLHLLDENTVIAKEETKMTIPPGESVILPCNSEDALNCAWQRRGFIVEMGGRYSYLSLHNELVPQHDFSIKITNFKDIDAGIWKCESMTDSGSTGIQLKHFELGKASSTDAQQESDNDIKKTITPQPPVSNSNAGVPREQMIPPTPPQITVTMSMPAQNGRSKRSLTMTHYEKVFHCTSKNGNPPPFLFWKLTNGEIRQPERSIVSDSTGTLFTSTISLPFSDLSPPFTANGTVLQCIAKHPAFDKPQTATYIFLSFTEGEEITSNPILAISIAVAVILLVVAGIVVLILFVRRRRQTTGVINDTTSETPLNINNSA